MASKIQKTNVARLLDAANISYSLVPYQVDEKDLSAVHVAQSLGENLDHVFKTIVLIGDKTGHLVCVIPSDAEVDLKKTAKISGNKKVELIQQKDLLGLTGYIRGGCSPIGMKKSFPTYFHHTILNFTEIYVSAGVRGLQLCIDPKELIAYISDSSVADII